MQVVGGRSSDWRRFYEKAFTRDAHQLLAWGYQDARGRIGPTLQEEEITGFIAEAIQNRLDDPRTPTRFTRYQVNEEMRARNSIRTGKRRKRIDIAVICSARLPRPEFIFEAKLLRKGHAPIGRYVGVDGMQCFLKGDYAAAYPSAAMMAYLQTDTPDRWYQELTRKFSEDKRHSLRTKKPLRRSLVLNALVNEWVSVHERHDRSEIKLFHIFLECD